MLKRTEPYQHADATSPMRPEVGAQAQFKKSKPPKTYRYDSSIAPELQWDEGAGRDQAEALLHDIAAASTLEGAKEKAQELLRMCRPFLNWAGRAERAAFDVPTLPLFVHERLSTAAILETLRGHKRDKQLAMDDLFGETPRSVADSVLRAYEYPEKWVNRLILGDSLVVMNSLLQFEQMGGQVQMVYFDPPYGISYKSNFQPFVRKREVANGEDADMTREPETVRAYRDTWTLGIHSWLTYLRDRALLARELLAPTGSFFLQINDENLSYARQVLEDVFGRENFVVTFVVKKKGAQRGSLVDPVNDYIVWVVRDKDRAKTAYRQLFEKVTIDKDLTRDFKYVERQDGSTCLVSELQAPSGAAVDYLQRPDLIPADFPELRVFAANPLTSGGVFRTQHVEYSFGNRTFHPGKGNSWKHSAITDDGSPSGMDKLKLANRLFAGENQLRFKRYLSDFGFKELSNWWDGLGGAGKPIYTVQTNEEIVKRCMLMTTDPGDLVLDITCGSGTTAVTAEAWGRRWITTDVSRVPLALARQRLLTSTFDYYELRDPSRGPAGGDRK